MHIVYVSREYPPTLRGGGIASYVRDMACYYASLGHRVTVVAASDDTRKESDETIDGVRIIRLSGGDFLVPQIEGNSSLKKLRCLYRFFTYRMKVKKTILSLQNVDVIEVAEFGAEGYYLMNLPIPVIIRLHTPSFLDRNSFKKKNYPVTKFYEHWCAIKEEGVLQQAKYVTSCSKSLGDWCQHYFNLPEEIIKVIHNPIHLKEWISLEPGKQMGATIHVLYVGTVCEEKGVGDLVTACKILIKQGKHVSLTIAGKLGHYGQTLKESLASEAWCKFTGHIDRKALKGLYASNDIACFPSWWEAFGIICTEAMATPLLTIGSREGGMSEIIEDGVDGFLIEPKKPDILAQKILFVTSLPAEQKKAILKNAQKKVQEKFEMSHVGKQMLDYYETVINDYRK